jgi:hypothetical protein
MAEVKVENNRLRAASVARSGARLAAGCHCQSTRRTSQRSPRLASTGSTRSATTFYLNRFKTQLT